MDSDSPNNQNAYALCASSADDPGPFDGSQVTGYLLEYAVTADLRSRRTDGDNNHGERLICE